MRKVAMLSAASGKADAGLGALFPVWLPSRSAGPALPAFAGRAGSSDHSPPLVPSSRRCEDPASFWRPPVWPL